MVRQVVIHTFCDPDYQDEMKTIEGETLTWFVQGARWEVDVCPAHKGVLMVDQMDDFVLRYGREWEDPEVAAKRTAEAERKRLARQREPSRARDRKVDPSAHVLIDGHLTDDEMYVCDVEPCPRNQVPIAKIQGFRMHQLQAHGMNAPKKGK
jgi:hypothetical protein